MKIFSEVERDYMDGMVKNADFIPLISKDEEEFLLTDDSIPTELPILPIRDNVLFPGVILPGKATERGKPTQSKSWCHCTTQRCRRP